MRVVLVGALIVGAAGLGVRPPFRKSLSSQQTTSLSLPTTTTIGDRSFTLSLPATVNDRSFTRAPRHQSTRLGVTAVQQGLPDFKDGKRLLESATNAFPLWVLASSIIGWFRPAVFDWFTPFVTPSLALTMLSMGMTLTLKDFQRVAQTPKWVLVGFLAQFSIMPLTAALLAKVCRLGPDLASGLILVGCAPGGTASNLVALIAGADVALSVLMTMASTIAAIVMTPLLTKSLAGGYVEIKAAELVASTLNVVLLPVLAGLALNTARPKLSQAVASYTPFMGVLLVSAICGCISAVNSGTALKTIGPGLVTAILGLHTVGFALGYLVSRRMGADESRARTISIETGMQNSALAVVLAKHFPNPLLSSLPGAFSATAHSIIGSALAAYWRRNKAATQQQPVNYAVSKKYW